jgi:hypothetical protein
MLSMTAYWPLVVVPHVGQLGAVPQPLEITNTAARRKVNRILDLIEYPPWLPEASWPAAATFRLNWQI